MPVGVGELSILVRNDYNLAILIYGLIDVLGFFKTILL